MTKPPKFEWSGTPVSQYNLSTQHYFANQLAGWHWPGKYLPACLITHTGTLSTASPRAARSNKSFRNTGKPLLQSLAILYKGRQVKVASG